MWMTWDDPVVKEQVTSLLDEDGEELTEQQLRKLEFCLIKSLDDLNKLNSGELLEVKDGKLHTWTHDNLIVAANWRRPTEQTEVTSIEEEKAKADYPILLARSVHHS